MSDPSPNYVELTESLEHVGAKAIRAERAELLGRFAIAKAKSADDLVQVEHGNLGEAVLREFFRARLPKRYGVTKGFLVSPAAKDGKELDEWDVIIYDAHESPILFLREDGGETKRGIPLQYAKAVVEVKATFNLEHVRKATAQLTKLDGFPIRGDLGGEEEATHLTGDFFTAAVFFGLEACTVEKFTNCLDALQPILTADHHFLGAAIIDDVAGGERSCLIDRFYLTPEDADRLRADNEISKLSAPLHNRRGDLLAEQAFLGSGFSKNGFQEFISRVIDRLGGGRWGTIPGLPRLGGFGAEAGGSPWQSLLGERGS